MSDTAAAIAVVRSAEQYLEKHREQLVREYGDKCLVVRDDEVHGAYPSLDEAVRAGYAKFGDEPFLAMAATEDDQQISPPASLLAMGLG